MTTYEIKSVKVNEQFSGSLDDAIARAKEIRDEYAPAFGVQVETASGEEVYDSEEQ
jgi:ABC-type cobalt transport system substrate-binding protein